LVPDAYSPQIAPVFAWYVTQRLIPARFHAVRIATESLEVAHSIDSISDPVILVMNHQAWWDPMIGLAMANSFWPSRRGVAPMDATQLEKFPILQKIGIFGIHPDDPESMAAMVEFVQSRFATLPRPTLMLTPQGQFADIRSPLTLRPGAAALAAKFPTCRVFSIAVEYAFWLDQKPEVLLRVQPVAGPDQVSTSGWQRALTMRHGSNEPEHSVSTSGWQRALTMGMQENGARLAALVMARDPAPFSTFLGGASSGTNPFYNLWNRLRGKSTELSTSHRR
jgi:hypothetical protein